jgi:hypothetical protein
MYSGRAKPEVCGPKQVRVADEFVAAGAWVSLLALAGTIWVLTTVYARDAAEIGASVEQLRNHKNLILRTVRRL